MEENLKDAAVSFLKHLQEAGEEFVLLPEKERESLQGLDKTVPAEEGPADRTASPQEEEGLEAFGQRISGCTLCELHRSRTNFVFGHGDPDADLMFIGEGPGAEEDRQGLPFVGASGKLLTKMIAAIGFKRSEVYIANLVKCRPPGNRDPQPPEIGACKDHLLAQIEKIKPKVIVTLGRFSAYYFQGQEASMRELRGKVTEFDGTKVVSTYHPAALLYNAGLKRGAWEDMLLARQVYDKQGGRPSSGEVFHPRKG